MRRFYVIVFVVLVVGCGPRIANKDSMGTTIVCFGDSITEGVGADAGKDYPSVLSEMLDLPVINEGVRGDTTADALKRIDEDVLAHDPKLVVVLLGGNDFLRKMPREETFRNMDEIISRLKDGGAMIVIGAINLGFLWDPHTKEYKRIAKKHGAIMLKDIMAGIMDMPSMKYDGIHPNAKGYKLIAERIYEVIRPIVGE